MSLWQIKLTNHKLHLAKVHVLLTKPAEGRESSFWFFSGKK